MFNDWTFDSQIMYTCHRYGGPATKEAIKDYIDFRDKTNLPMYMGEIGHNTDECETPRGTYQEWREARPNQQLFRQLLMQYAENSRFSNCQPQESYIQSLGLKQ